MPTMIPSLLMRSMSVILTAFADRTRNITDILRIQKRILKGVNQKSQQSKLCKSEYMDKKHECHTDCVVGKTYSNNFCCC